MKKLKPKHLAYMVFMTLPLAMTLVFFKDLPEQIPGHYGATGAVDRMGYKFEALIIPILSLVLGGLFIFLSLFEAKEEKSSNAVLAISGTLIGVFTALQAYILFDSLGGTGPAFDINQVLFAATGLAGLVSSKFIPDLERNSTTGIRTLWSQKTDRTWTLSQKAGAKTIRLASILMVLTSVFSKGLACFIINMTIFIGLIPIIYYQTYRIYQEEKSSDKTL